MSLPPVIQRAMPTALTAPMISPPRATTVSGRRCPRGSAMTSVSARRAPMNMAGTMVLLVSVRTVFMAQCRTLDAKTSSPVAGICS